LAQRRIRTTAEDTQGGHLVSNLADAVYIVEDDDELRQCLGRGLSARGFATDSFASIQAFRAAVASLQPGCVLADLRIPGGGAMDLLQQMSQQWMAFPIIVMTAYSDVSIAVAAMKQGALDFIEKPFTEEAVIELIRSVQKRVESAINQHRQAEGLSEAARIRAASLTPREREVLERLLLGNPNKVVAGQLGLSTRTVEVYRARLLKKMQVRNLAQLASLTTTGDGTTSFERKS
jgi:two-component system response regulator FixJ